MKPGRELDALVAENVFGYRKFKRPWKRGIHGGTTDAWIDEKGVELIGLLPDYSTDIAAAWEVVEKMIARPDCQLDFELVPAKGAGGAEWAANFGDSTQREFAQTAPHAICLAALKAVEAA